MMKDDEVAAKIGYVLSTSHELSENILRRLDYPDLISAIQVCETWHSIGKHILNKERKLKYTTIHPLCLPNTQDDEKESMVHKSSHETLDQFLKRIPAFPSTCLGFTNGEWLFRPDIKTEALQKVSTLYAALNKALTSKSQLSLLSASGVVGTVQKSALNDLPNQNQKTSISLDLEDSEDSSSFTPTSSSSAASQPPQPSSSNLSTPNTSSHSTKMERDLCAFDAGYSIEIEEAFNEDDPEDLDGFTLVVVPNQPGIKISIVNLEEDHFFYTYRPKDAARKNLEISDEELNSMCGIESSEPVKAFFLFYCELNDQIAKAFKTAVMQRENSKLAMGGGLIRSLQDRKPEPHQGSTAIIFSGSKVSAASVVVPKTITNISTLKECLAKFCDFYMPGSQTLCFMFACCGRGRLWYAKKQMSHNNFYNVESRTFRQLFPQVPIFGFFGEGEFGQEFFPVDVTTPDLPKKRKKNLSHQFTTIFVMVSFS